MIQGRVWKAVTALAAGTLVLIGVVIYPWFNVSLDPSSLRLNPSLNREFQQFGVFAIIEVDNHSPYPLLLKGDLELLNLDGSAVATHSGSTSVEPSPGRVSVTFGVIVPSSRLHQLAEKVRVKGTISAQLLGLPRGEVKIDQVIEIGSLFKS